VAGKTTSAAFGYRIGAPIAIADLASAEARQDGACVDVNIAGTLFAGKVVLGATFDAKGTRMR